MALNHEIKICQKISWHCHLNRIRTATWSRRPKCVFATKFSPGPSLWRKERFGGGKGGDVCVSTNLRRLHRRLSRNSRAISWRNVWNNYSKEPSPENFQRILKTSFFFVYYNTTSSLDRYRWCKQKPKNPGLIHSFVSASLVPLQFIAQTVPESLLKERQLGDEVGDSVHEGVLRRVVGRCLQKYK